MNIDSRVIVHARDYLEQEMHSCFDLQGSMIQVIQSMNQHPFVKWVGKQPYFQMVKGRLEGQTTVVNADNPRVSEFRRHFALEGLIAFVIVSTKKIETDLLNQVTVNKTESQSMSALLKKVHSRFTDGKIYFGNGVKQQLITILIDDVLKKPEYSPFSSKKDHEYLLRHAFITCLMEKLSRIYVNLTDTLVVDVTLDIVDHIFSLVDRGELQKLIKTIRSVVEDENRLLQKTVYDIYINGLD